MNQIGLEIGVNAGSFTLGLNQMDVATKSFQRSIFSMGRAADASFDLLRAGGAALAGVGTSVLAGAFKLADAAGPFEAAMAEVAMWSGASATQLEALQRAAFDARNALIGFSATDSAKALGALAKEGVSARDAITTLNPALLFAGLASKSAEAGATALVKILREFHIDASNASAVVDQLAASARLFHVPVEELSNGLRKTAVGATLVGASMSDTLLALGLVRQTLPDTAAAATATNRALIQLANPKSAAALEQLGVSVKNAHGAFRGLPAVLGDLADKTANMTDAARAQAFTTAFGARSAGAMLGAVKDLAVGIDNGSGSLLKGADAVAFLTAKMGAAGGAADAMRSQMLTSFAGQKEILSKASESLATAAGVPFAKVMAPLVGYSATAIAKLAEMIGSADPTITKFAASAVLLGGVLAVVLGGGLMIAGGAFLPLIAAMGAAALGAAAFGVAAEKNVGGLGGFFSGAVDKAKLAISAIAQLFSQGGFSGDVLASLDAGNQGIENFAINIFVWVNRAKEWLSGLVDGFESGIAKAQPVFDAFSAALDTVASRFGFLSAAVDPLANGDAFNAAGEAGKSWGDKLARAADVVVNAMTAAINIGIGVADAWDLVAASVAPAAGIFDQVSDAVTGLLSDMRLLDSSVDSSGSSWRAFGAGLSGVVSIALAGLMSTLDAVASQVKAFAAIFGGAINVVVGLFSGDWSRAFLGAKEIAYGVLSSVIGLVGAMVSGVAHALDALGNLAGKELGLGKTVDDFRHSVDLGLRDDLGVYGETTDAKKSGAPVPGDHKARLTDAFGGGAFPAGTTASIDHSGMQSAIADLRAEIAAMRAAKAGDINVTSTIILDGEVAGRSIAKASTSNAARGGIPVSPET